MVAFTSLIVTVLNRESRLRATIVRILDQVDIDIELPDWKERSTDRCRKTAREDERHNRYRRRLVALVTLPLLGVAVPGVARAQLIVPAPDGTNTIVTPAANLFTITGGTQAGNNLFHSFQRFGLSQGQIANFLATPEIRNILGRTNGGEPSVINGLLRVTGSNANLYLMNPAGIVFGPTAQLNIPGSFTATTANGIGFGCGATTCNGWFGAIGSNNYANLVGEPGALAFTMSQPGAIVNAGNLRVNPGQSLTLVGGTVVNTGSLNAPGGQVTIAAVPGSQLVRLTPANSLLSLEFNPLPLAPGSLPPALPFTPLALPQLLTGGNLGSATGLVTNADGTVSLVGSAIRLPTTAGTAIAAGSINTAIPALRPSPVPLSVPTVNVLGSQVALVGATIDASGVVGGGTVRIGGDFRGGGSIPVANRTLVDLTSRIVADSLVNGNGGRVAIWAEQATDFGGRISARGGAQGGDGGFVEVSGRNALNYRGFVDVSAPAGNPGTLLLDPTDITIVAGRGGFGDALLPDIFAGNLPGVGITLSEGALEGFTSGNVILEATNNITIASLENASLDFLTAGSITLRADADGDGIGSFLMSPLFTITTDGAPIAISGASLSLGDIVTTSLRLSSSGDVTLRAPGNISVGDINTSPLSVLRAGNVDIISANGSITTGNLFTNSLTQAGAVTLTAASRGGNVEFASISAAGIGLGFGAPVRITAGEFVQGTGFIDGATTPTIDTSGAIGSGPITIRHRGDLSNTPFIVGDATTNGTAGAIVAGSNRLLPTRSFRGNFIQGNIQILTTTATLGRDLGNSETLVDDLLEPGGDEPSIGLAPEQAVELDGNITEIAQLEEDFDAEFEDYLDLPENPTVLPAPPDDVLSRIGTVTGIKPALVYASFVPANVSTTKQPQGRTIAQSRRITPSTGSDNNDIWRFDSQLASRTPEPTRRDNLAPSDNDLLELVVVTADGNPIRKLVAGATRTEVLRVTRQLLNEITDIRKVRTTSYLAPAQQLYRWLVAPIAAELQARGIRNLAYISDTGLRFIPLVALHDGRQFLVEQYSVGLMPSLSLTDTRYVSLRNARVLAMGASEFTDQLPLPAVPIELAVITENLRQGESFLNQEFTLANLKAQRQQEPYKIIHLATHGAFQPGALSNSYIQLWDTRLQLDQLRQLGWSNPPVELLVLSACRTAFGSDDAELGFAGLAVQAGVKSALASLWNVSDEGTLAFMTEFYRQLQVAPIKAEALRQAQMAMLQGKVQVEGNQLRGSKGEALTLPATLAIPGSRQLSHPYYWAAFTLVGSPW